MKDIHISEGGFTIIMAIAVGMVAGINFFYDDYILGSIGLALSAALLVVKFLKPGRK